MKCAVCENEKATKGERIPMGWHRLADEVFCGSCWGGRYILRAVTFPVIGPSSQDWPALRSALADGWAESTMLANWAITELAKNDVIRKAVDANCPAMPPIYLYGLAKKTYSGWGRWSGCYASANSILRAAEQKYRASRFQTIWLRERSLLSFRYPFPFPVHNDNWTAATVAQRPTVTANIAGRKVMLILKGGAEMARQLTAFRQIESGRAVQGELAIYRVRSHPGDHRKGASETGHGTPRAHFRVMAKLVAWLPRTEVAIITGRPYKIATAEDSFLLGADGWRLNSDFMRTAVANHRVFLDRMAEDTKYEKRWPKRKLRNINEFRAARCLKQNNRLKTFCQQTASMIGNRAMRLGCDSILFDDSERGYFADGFCWADFRACLAKAADDHGITVIANGDVVNETPETARVE